MFSKNYCYFCPLWLRSLPVLAHPAMLVAEGVNFVLSGLITTGFDYDEMKQNGHSWTEDESKTMLSDLRHNSRTASEPGYFINVPPLLLVLCRSKGVLFSRPYSPVRRSLTKPLRATKSSALASCVALSSSMWSCARFGAVYEISGLESGMISFMMTKSFDNVLRPGEFFI